MGEAIDCICSVHGYEFLYVVNCVLVPGVTSCVAQAPIVTTLAEWAMEAMRTEDIEEDDRRGL